MRFRLFGTEIYLSFLFLAAITVMLAIDKTGTMLPMLFAVVMHECGHLFMMWLQGCAPKRIKLIPASVQITNPFIKGYKNDILISLAGPAVNILLFGVLYYNYICYQNAQTLWFALVNLIIGLFNLLPIEGLDGGIVLYSILCRVSSLNRAALTVKLLTILCAAAALVAAITLTCRGRINISLYIMAIYLFVIGLMRK